MNNNSRLMTPARIRLATYTLIAGSVVMTAVLITTLSNHQDAPQVVPKKENQTPSPYHSKRGTRNALNNDLPLQLQKFRDGILSQNYDSKRLSEKLSTIPRITQKQANIILEEIGEERLANYLEKLPKELRDDDANNQMLYLLLVDHLIENNSLHGIDTISRIKPIALFPSQYSNLLTKAALDPTGRMASLISEKLLPPTSWPIHIDGKLLSNLVDSGLGIKSAIERLESLPGGKDLAAAAVVQHYLIDDTYIDLDTPDGKDLLAYINNPGRISFHSVALIAKLTKASNENKSPINIQETESPEKQRTRGARMPIRGRNL